MAVFKSQQLLLSLGLLHYTLGVVLILASKFHLLDYRWRVEDLRAELLLLVKVIHFLEGLIHHLRLSEQRVVHLVIVHGSVDPGLF